MVNFILAIIWLSFGCGLLFLRYFGGQERVESNFFVINTSLIGWLAIVLAAYNFVRWYSQLQGKRVRQVLERQDLDRPRPAHHREEEPPNPDFDFTKQPPSAN